MNKVESALSRTTDTKALVIGTETLPQVADMFRKLFPDKRALVVADANTWRVAGDDVHKILAGAGVAQDEPYVFTDPKLYAEWAYVGELDTVLSETDAVPVAVGSGVINDLTKLCSSHNGRRYMVVGTAASMDGYTAYGASITKDGNKQTFDCPAPLGMVLDWGPSLLSQSKGVSMSHAGWLVAMFEIAGIVGMLFAGWATDKWLRGRAHRTCVFCMAGAALFVFLFWQLPADAPVWLLFLTLCAAGFCIYGPQALIGIAAANQATKKAAATANGLTGLFGYASTVVSGVGLGFVAQHYGWNWAYVGIIGVAIVGMLVFLMMWGARADGYDAEPERN